MTLLHSKLFMFGGALPRMLNYGTFHFQQVPVASSVLLGINHPRNPELIDAHTKARRPEGLLKRHRHLSVLSQRVEDALAFGRVLHMNRHVNAFWFLVTPRRSIGALKHLVADVERRVHDQFV